MQPLSPDHNFANAEAFIRAAAQQGAHLAVLPEYGLTSWAPHSSAFPSVCRLAATRHLARFQALARELAIALVPGTFVEEEPAPATAACPSPSPSEPPSREPSPAAGTAAERTRQPGEAEGPGTAGDAETVVRQNVCYFIASSGEIAARYSKLNLWHPERGYLTPSFSRAHEPFETELGLRVGLLICWDLAFPEALRELVRKGAQMVIVPAWWLASDAGAGGGQINPCSESVFLDSLVVCRAFENTCAVVFVNAGGPPPPYRSNFEDAAEGGNAKTGGELEYTGLSQVGMPLLGSLGRIASSDEGMSIVEIDTDVLDVAEAAYKVREDLGKEGWHYGSSSG